MLEWFAANKDGAHSRRRTGVAGGGGIGGLITAAVSYRAVVNRAADSSRKSLRIRSGRRSPDHGKIYYRGSRS